jgi:hypothetical protein
MARRKKKKSKEQRIAERIERTRRRSVTLNCIIGSKTPKRYTELRVIKNGVDISKSKMADRKEDLFTFAINLEQNLPKSEIWFRSKYEKFRDSIPIPTNANTHLGRRREYGITDHYNCPFHGFIPDVVNNKFKYIIEVDGPIHLLPEVIERDKAKQLLYEYHGYKVFRVIAFDEESFKSFKIEYTSYITPKL